MRNHLAACKITFSQLWSLQLGTITHSGGFEVSKLASYRLSSLILIQTMLA